MRKWHNLFFNFILCLYLIVDGDNPEVEIDRGGREGDGEIDGDLCGVYGFDCEQM